MITGLGGLPGITADHHGIGRSQSLDSGRNIWGFSEGKVLLTPLSTHSPNNDQPRMYPESESQSDPLLSLQTATQGFHRSEHP